MDRKGVSTQEYREIGKKILYRTAIMTHDGGNFLYPAGTCVGVSYEGLVDGIHYFAVQVGQKPAVIVSEEKLTNFVL